jgi:DNA repair protein RadA/Sms
VVEHLVDTVLSFEGERHHSLRLLRAVKHRFGPAGELGLFEMADAGLKAVPDASGLLLQDRRSDVAGSVVVPVIEGRRPLLVEVQALVAPSPYRVPSRSTQGVDGGRLSLLLAVLQRYGGVGLQRHDVFVSAVGGVKVGEPAADLAVALSIASVVVGSPLPADTVVFGEVGLGGELRQVRDSERRLAEAARLGFRRAIVPASVSQRCAGLAVERVATLAQAIDVAGYRRVVSLEERRRQRAACRPGVADRKRR